MPDKECPHCGLWNTDFAIRCNCGYHFSKGMVEDSYNQKQISNTEGKTLLVLLWSINIIFGLLLLTWPIALYMSLFFFDAPASKIRIAEVSAWSVWTYPVVYLIALIGSFLLHRKNQHKVSILFSILPIINIIGGGLIFLA